MSDGTPIDAEEIQLWRELQQVTGNATVSIVCARKGRAARMEALRAAIAAERAARGPARRGGRRREHSGSGRARGAWGAGS